MCGIVGFIKVKLDGPKSRECLRTMVGALAHRGPDDEGLWVDAETGIALGHRRLSIVDLSPEGHQPMASRSGRYHLCFNGEIYNFRELRKELESAGYGFRGHSDTEIMLAAIEEWGLEAAVGRFIGMFALALWDRRNHQLHLVRDRLGEKPLYYGWMGDTFLFGSELKALRAHPDWQGQIDRNALALLMRHNYIPAPYSIYQGIFKLVPGTILTLSAAGGRAGRVCRVISYWTAKKVAEDGMASGFTGTEAEAVERLDTLLRNAIGRQMLADVPLGAFLSGGIDSSTVVALMQAQSNRPVKTFTIGFDDAGFNEAVYARAVAKHLGTDHTELYVKPVDAIEVIPKLATIYDEPFSDSSQIPTFLVAQLAKRHVTVCLSGDGGDELFCGYKRYLAGRDLWRINRFPVPRHAVAKVLKSVPTGTWDGLFSWASPLLNRYGRAGSIGDKLHKVAEVLDFATPDAMYHGLVSHWKEPTSLVLNSVEPVTALTDPERIGSLHGFTQRMMLLDTISYLPDDILVKVDRACMAVSLESRLPFLDHHLVEFAWQVPVSMKIREGQGKWLLRQVLSKYVPKGLTDRPKMGFGIPLGDWLRGPLREWADALLDKRRLQDEGFFNPEAVDQKWKEHLSASCNWQYYLWDVLMFQQWLEQQ